MARSIDSALQVARNVLRQADGWFTFVEIGIENNTFRLVENEENVVVDGCVWMACGMIVEIPEEDREGSLGELLVTVPNESQLPMAYVEVDDEILGRYATVRFHHESRFGQPFAPQLAWRHRVLDVEMNEKVARFRCGHTAELQQIPAPIFTRNKFPQLLRRGGVKL